MLGRVLKWAGGIVAAGAALWMNVYFTRGRLEQDDQLASLISVIIGLAGLALTVYGTLTGRRIGPAPPPDTTTASGGTVTDPPIPSGVQNEISGGGFHHPVIQGRDITVQLPPQAPPALSGLPTGSAAFTGRTDEKQAVLSAIAPPGVAVPPCDEGDEDSASTAVASAMAVAAISGMGGIGKTELAIQVARTALDLGWFPGGVLFVDLFGYDPARRLKPDQALEGFLRALGIPGELIPSDTQGRTRLYASALSTYAQRGQRILVVIDNASTLEQSRPLLPTDGSNRAIVTSRHTLGMLGARLLDLDTLTSCEAVALLNRALRIARPEDARVSDHPDQAATVAKLCGGLPLALQIVAALLVDAPAQPLSTMAANLADAGSRLEEMAYGEVAVRAAFELSYRHLSPDQAQLFRLLPVNPGPHISIASATVLTGLKPARVRQLLGELARAHLIEHGTAYGRWRMHDLVRLFAEQHGCARAHADNRQQVLTRLLNHYLTTAIAADLHLSSPNPTLSAGGFGDREQALTWLDAEYPNLVAAVHTAADGIHHTIARDLPLALTRFLAWRRLFTDLITLNRLALDAARHLTDRRGEAGALSNLGIALRGVGRFNEAVTACEQAATILCDISDRHSEGIALSNLGSALHGAQRFNEAITAYRQAIHIFHETGDLHNKGMLLVNLGGVLRQVGRFGEAVTTQHDAATIYRDTGDRHNGGATLADFGIAPHGARHFDEAITACRQAATVYRDIGDRQGEGTALNSAGIALREVGCFDEAITACQQAATIFRDIGDRHSEGTALANLGWALHEARRSGEAITACQQAIHIFRETEDRHSESMALTNLGRALHRVRRFSEAITDYQDAVAIFHETGDRHNESMALTNLGRALHRVDRFSEAITAQRDAANICRETGDRYGEIIAMDNLKIAQDVRSSALVRTRTRRLLVAVLVGGVGAAVAWLTNWQAGVVAAVGVAAVGGIRSATLRRRNRSSTAPSRNCREPTTKTSRSTENTS